MTSALYTGVLGHTRSRPVTHTFHYPAALFYLDLDELESLGRELRLFGVNAPSLFGFRDSDHMDGCAGSTRGKLECFARTQGVDLTGGKIYLLTQCRMLGYVFNPVSFYYCHGPAGALRAIVAEVNNTFGERHLYWLDERTRENDPARPLTERHRAEKRMHVSPFVSMDAAYEFRFAPVGERLSVHIAETEHGEHFFDAHLSATRRPLDDLRLTMLLLRYPLLTLRVTAAIHWQALRLWRKGAPVYRQPVPSSEQAAQTRLLHEIARGLGT